MSEYRPDGSINTFNTPLNKDKNYFLPTYLSNIWMKGNYEIVVKHKGNQIGNISFYVTDDVRR
jgi:hypothetical protein